MHLAKLHATGNDFLVAVDGDAGVDALDGAAAVALCHRHRGVGADGLIRLEAGRANADVAMTLWNADGSEAEISGNGVRCLAAVAAARGLVADTFSLATGAGVRAVTVARDDAGTVVAASVDMGPPTTVAAEVPTTVAQTRGLVATVDGIRYEGDAVGMGNPHLVLHLDSPAAVAAVPLDRHGPVLEHDARFPRRTNVHFVAVARPDVLALRTWERGAGATDSCGSGASATAASAHARGLVGAHVTVEVPGGVLTVDLGPTIRLGGPVVAVFDVDVELAPLLGRAGVGAAP